MSSSIHMNCLMYYLLNQKEKIPMKCCEKSIKMNHWKSSNLQNYLIRDSDDLLELSLVELEAHVSAELLELLAKLENSDSDELIEVSRE